MLAITPIVNQFKNTHFSYFSITELWNHFPEMAYHSQLSIFFSLTMRKCTVGSQKQFYL